MFSCQTALSTHDELFDKQIPQPQVMADDQFHFFNHGNDFCILSKMSLLYFSNRVALYSPWPPLTSRLARSPLCSFFATYLTHYIVGPYTSCVALACSLIIPRPLDPSFHYILLNISCSQLEYNFASGNVFSVYMLLHNKCCCALWLGTPVRMKQISASSTDSKDNESIIYSIGQ